MITQQRSTIAGRVPTEWVLLSYRIPREPSTPRIAVWRRLRQLGVVQVGDGLVALPSTANTIEQLEWVAERVSEVNGYALVWSASPTRRSDSAALAEQLNGARNDEYGELIDEASKVSGTELIPRTVTRLRRKFRQIEKRDYLSASSRGAARRTLDDLQTSLAGSVSR